jgi:hypothetical protein
MHWVFRKVQRRGGIFIAYSTFVLREVREFSTPGIFLLAIIVCSMTKRQTRGGEYSAKCVQRMHYGTHCHPSGTSEFAVRKEGKEEYEEFLS